MSLPPSLSIYRGYSQVGIGDGPGRPVTHGEQYLAADALLRADGPLLEAAAPWMTLDATPGDYRTVGDRFEAWSYFGVERWRFVVRLTEAERYDVRHAYFAHGRAWPVDAFSGVFDAGVVIGRAGAFERPWRDETARAPFEPHAALAAPVDAPEESATTAALVSHLYQALVQGYPVIWAVPLMDFTSGSGMQAIVAFARAALPLALKRDCRIRVYTRHPDLYLTESATNLVVVPEDEAANALAARRDATLLDRRGARIAGREPAAPFLKYAELLLRWGTDHPAALLRFAERVDRRPWAHETPRLEPIAEVPFIYTLASKLGSQTDVDDFVRSLFNTLDQRQIALPWRELVTTGDLSQCSDSLLIDLILEAAQTDDARHLQAMIETAAAQRGLQLDATIDAQWRSTMPAKGAAERLLQLVGAGVLSPAQAAGRLQHVSAGVVAELAAGSGPLAVVIKLTDAGLLRPDWILPAVERADREALGTLTQWILKSAQPEIREWLWSALDQFITRGVEVPADLEPPLARLLRGEPEFDRRLLLAEVAYRAQPGDRSTSVERLVVLVTSRNDRRRLIEAMDQPRWRVLQGLSIPHDWQRDVVNVLFLKERARRRLGLDEVLRLGDAIDDGDRDTLRVWAELVTDDFTRNPQQTTQALLQRGQWLTWRLAISGALTPPSVSYEWLIAPFWRDHEPLLEEWKLAIGDVRAALEYAQVESIANRLPTIRGFEHEQLDDLVAAPADLPGLALLARRCGPAVYARIQGFVSEREVAAQWLQRGLAGLGERFDYNAHPPEFWQTLDELLTRVPVTVAPSPARKRIGALARRHGHLHLANALDPALVDESGLIERLVSALKQGDGANRCWRDLAESGSRMPGTIADLVVRIRELDDEALQQIDRRGMRGFMDAVDRHRTLLNADDLELRPLPALRLAAVIDDTVSIGTLAARLATSPAAMVHASERLWWAAVLAGLTLPRRTGLRSGTDSAEAAVGLLSLCAPPHVHDTFRAASRGVRRSRDEVLQ